MARSSLLGYLILTCFISLVIIGIGGCENATKHYSRAAGEYERYHKGWYEKAELVNKGERLFYKANKLLYEMHPAGRISNRFHVYIDNDTLEVSFKKGKRKVDHLMVRNGMMTYQLKNTCFNKNNTVYNPAQLKEDFRQLQNILNRLHPSLHGPITKHDFNQKCFRSHKALETSMSVEDFYKIVGPIVTSLGCGHTSIWMPRGYWEDSTRSLFPIEMVFLRDGVSSKRMFDNSRALPYGSRILSVNGEPVMSLVNNLKPYISADAYSNGYRNYRLNRRFSYLYALIYGYPNAFNIEYQPPQSRETKSCSCEPTTVKNIRNNFEFSPVLELSFKEPERLAVIRISSFYYLNNKRFCEFVDRAFKEIYNNGTPNLIIDIRGNDGGCPFCAAHLLSYLANESFTYFEEPYGKFAELAEPVSVQEKRFQGNLFILIDGGCFSTSGQFCSLLKYHKIGRLIGSETGGAHICNESHKIIELKNTRLRLQVARSSFGTAVEGLQQRQGIRPDDLIEQTISEFQQGIDPVMDYAIKLCKENI